MIFAAPTPFRAERTTERKGGPIFSLWRRCLHSECRGAQVRSHVCLFGAGCCLVLDDFCSARGVPPKCCRCWKCNFFQHKNPIFSNNFSSPIMRTPVGSRSRLYFRRKSLIHKNTMRRYTNVSDGKVQFLQIFYFFLIHIFIFPVFLFSGRCTPGDSEYII